MGVYISWPSSVEDEAEGLNIKTTLVLDSERQSMFWLSDGSISGDPVD